MTNMGWRDLPEVVREEVRQRTGGVVWTTPVADGWSTDFRIIMETPGFGQVFIKGLAPGQGKLYDAQRARLDLGADLAEHVEALSPELLFRLESGGWRMTAWEALPGSRSRFSPKSPDVPKVAGVLAQLREIEAPDVVTGSAREDWGRWAAKPEVLDGDYLVHSDPRPENFVIDGDDVWLVDWGHAIRGPSWLTSALCVLELIEAGWHPRDAEAILRDVPSWDTAPAEEVQIFADANAEMWRRAWEKTPEHRMRRDKFEVARVWADYRETGW